MKREREREESVLSIVDKKYYSSARESVPRPGEFRGATRGNAEVELLLSSSVSSLPPSWLSFPYYPAVTKMNRGRCFGRKQCLIHSPGDLVQFRYDRHEVRKGDTTPAQLSPETRCSHEIARPGREKGKKDDY